MVTVNNRLKFEIEIVHNLSCHPIILKWKNQLEKVRRICIIWHRILTTLVMMMLL